MDAPDAREAGHAEMTVRPDIKPHLTKDGVWYVRLDLGRSPATGRRIQPYRQFPDARDEGEAVEMALEWASTLNIEGRTSKTYVSDLAREYVDRFEKLGKSPNTAKTYRTCLGWVDPFIGSRVASEITANDIADVEWFLLTRGGRDGDGLAASSVQLVHWFLSSLWKWMARAGVVEHNVVQLVDKPSYITPEAFAFCWDDMRRLHEEILDAVRTGDDRAASDAFAAWTSFHTGMRCGEVCALRKRDLNRPGRYFHVCGNCIDTDDGTIRRATTKGRRQRNVTITADDLSVADAYLEARRADAGPDDPIIMPSSGKWPPPDAISAAFRRLCRNLGIKGTFHTLRHTHATWLISEGVPITTVSKRLGHSKPSVTMDIYAHAFAGDDDRAARVMDSVAGCATVVQREEGANQKT